LGVGVCVGFGVALGGAKAEAATRKVARYGSQAWWIRGGLRFARRDLPPGGQKAVKGAAMRVAASHVVEILIGGVHLRSAFACGPKGGLWRAVRVATGAKNASAAD